MGIKLVLTVVATPRAAGQVERVNNVVLEKLTAMIPEEKTWDKDLDRIRMSTNNTINETTRKAPNELFFGSRPRLPEAPLAYEIDPEIDN